LKAKKSKSKSSKAKKEVSPDYIINHVLVPRHILLSEEEKKEVIEKYAGGDPYKLPYILSTDPVVKILGAKPGDVIKIIRKSPTAGESIYYRLVVR
jgi:DNA-directed RNA polymerase subunit H